MSTPQWGGHNNSLKYGSFYVAVKGYYEYNNEYNYEYSNSGQLLTDKNSTQHQALAKFSIHHDRKQHPI